jgi:chemotaxis protein MotB
MPLHREREEDLENLLNRGALWAVTYGDLMSYLMIFFLLMFTFAMAGGRGFEEGVSRLQEAMGGPANPARIERAIRRSREEMLAQDLDAALEAHGLREAAGVQVFEDKVKLTLREGILFDSGKPFLKPQALPLLKRVAELVRSLPNSLMVEGHTDDVPLSVDSKYESNWQLSMARALTVIRYFVDVEEIDPKRLSGVGYGQYRPLAPNTSAAGRALNRRIEISLLRE